jgi:hypothetical protein
LSGAAPSQVYAYNSRPLKSNQDLNLEPDPEDNTICPEGFYASEECIVEDDTKLTDMVS